MGPMGLGEGKGSRKWQRVAILGEMGPKLDDEEQDSREESEPQPDSSSDLKDTRPSNKLWGTGGRGGDRRDLG